MWAPPEADQFVHRCDSLVAECAVAPLSVQREEPLQRLGPPRKRLPIRIPGSNRVRGTNLPPILTALGTTPGTTLRLPDSIPPMASSATSCGATCARGMLKRSALAISPHSVGTGPGHKTVTETPVPCSSSWTASEKV